MVRRIRELGFRTDPVEVEDALIEVFKENHQGRHPFANRIDGTITT